MIDLSQYVWTLQRVCPEVPSVARVLGVVLPVITPLGVVPLRHCTLRF